MFKFRPIKVLKFLTEFFYLSLVFCLPVFFSFFLKTSNVFELEKAVLFRIFIILFLYSFLLLALFDRESFIKFKLRFKKFWKFFLIPLFFIGGVFLMTIFSDYPIISFWGTYDYQFGLYNFLYIFIFFISSVLWLDSELRIERLLKAISLAALLVCLYGVLQFFGLDSFLWSENTRGRIFSSLGQPNFFASYLLLVLPLSAYLFYSQKNIWRYLYGLTFLLEIFCLFFTYSRAGLLGIIGAILIFLTYFFLKNYRVFIGVFFCERKYLLSLIFLFTIILIIFSSFSGFQKKRLLNTFNIRIGSVASRVQYFQSAWTAFTKKPLLGYGWQTQREIFAGYYEKDWGIYNKVNAVPAQAHNVIFDYLLQGGIVGLAFWLLLNAYFFRLAWINIQKDKARGLSMAIIFGWVSYTISLFFGFAILTTELYLWLFLAILIVSGQGYGPELLEVDFQKNKQKNKMIFLGAKITLAVIIMFVVFIFSRRELRTIIADHYFYKIESALAINQHFEAYVLYEWIKELGINDYYYRVAFADLLSHSINKNDNGVWVEGAQRLIFPNLVSKILGNTYEEVCTRANVYAAMSLNKKTNYSNQAENDFKKCISKAVNIPKNYRDFARFYFGQGKYLEAENYLDKAEVLLPDLQDEGLNEDHRRNIKEELYLDNVLRGDIYVEKKNYTQAEYFYRQAKNNLNSGSQIDKKIADTFYLRGDYDSAIKILLEIEKSESTNYYWPYLIAFIYAEKEEYDSADLYLKEAENISPKNSYVLELRKNIDEKMLKK